MGGNVETDWDSVLEDPGAPAVETGDTADAPVVPETETPAPAPVTPAPDAPTLSI